MAKGKPTESHEGWFLVSRSLSDPKHELHPHSTGEPACRMAAWVDLIGLARWKDGGGLVRGQLSHSERFLATRWNRHRSWVSRFLEDLEASKRITRSANHEQVHKRVHKQGRKPGHITICNYDSYQMIGSTSRSTNRTASEPRIGPKKKEEVSNTPLGVPPAHEKSKQKKPHPIPDDWQPHDAHRERATELGFDADDQAAAFRDHHAATGKRYVDWDRAFFTWLRKSDEFRGRDGRGRTGKIEERTGIRATDADFEPGGIFYHPADG